MCLWHHWLPFIQFRCLVHKSAQSRSLQGILSCGCPTSAFSTFIGWHFHWLCTCQLSLVDSSVILVVEATPVMPICNSCMMGGAVQTLSINWCADELCAKTMCNSWSWFRGGGQGWTSDFIHSSLVGHSCEISGWYLLVFSLSQHLAQMWSTCLSWLLTQAVCGSAILHPSCLWYALQNHTSDLSFLSSVLCPVASFSCNSKSSLTKSESHNISWFSVIQSIEAYALRTLCYCTPDLRFQVAICSNRYNLPFSPMCCGTWLYEPPLL